MIELESMAVEMPVVEGHPNRTAFRGVLTVVDVASERAPAGAKGHRVVLTRAAAEKALPSLLGMALDYAPTFDRHDQRRKVGVITSAEVVDRDLQVGGYLFAKDFPDVVEEVARNGRKFPTLRKPRRMGQPRVSHSLCATKVGQPSELGMSFEVADAILADNRAHVWILTKVTFTGAAILRRDKAAYEDTWIELV